MISVVELLFVCVSDHCVTQNVRHYIVSSPDIDHTPEHSGVSNSVLSLSLSQTVIGTLAQYILDSLFRLDNFPSTWQYIDIGRLSHLGELKNAAHYVLTEYPCHSKEIVINRYLKRTTYCPILKLVRWLFDHDGVIFRGWYSWLALSRNNKQFENHSVDKVTKFWCYRRLIKKTLVSFPKL